VACFTHVSDPGDPRLTDYLNLTDVELRKSLEAEHGLFVAEGEKVIRRAAAAGYRVRSLLATEQKAAGLADLAAVCGGPSYVVPAPVAEQLTRGAFLGSWRLMAIDGFEWDTPATQENAVAFGHYESDVEVSAYPKVRVVTISECASHAVVGAQMGGITGTGSGEQTLARGLYARLEPDWLLIADRNFYSWVDWCAAADSGAQLLWRVKVDLRLPVLEFLPDGSYMSVLISPKIGGKARKALLDAVRTGRDHDPRQVRMVRVVEYAVADRDGEATGEVIGLITTITDPHAAPAPLLAQTYHERWEHETGNKQLKTYLRGPGRVLRSKSPDMVRQEIYGYLLTHYAISALICRAATEADIDPDRVKFKRTVRLVRRRLGEATAFSP